MYVPHVVRIQRSFIYARFPPKVMSERLTRRRFLVASGGVLAVGGAGCLGDPGGEGPSASTDWNLETDLSVETIEQYNSPGCSCCEGYAEYLRANVTGTVSDSEVEDVTTLKRDLGVPQELQSCHTAVIGEYVIEGHVPVAAISTLLEESPAVDGIALPGMPTGAPGMGGQKRGALTVQTFSDGVAGDVFTEF